MNIYPKDLKCIYSKPGSLELVSAVGGKASLDDFTWVVLFSGGKDSTAALLRSLDLGLPISRVIYVEVVGNTHRLNIDYVYWVSRRLNVPLVHLRTPIDFSEGLRRWGKPLTKRNRWCMRMKIDTALKYIRMNLRPPVILVDGIKVKDSKHRASYLPKLIRGSEYYLVVGSRRIPIFRKTFNMFSCCIIYDWSTDDVWSYIRSVDPDVYSRLKFIYDTLGNSGSCIKCPLVDKL